MLKIISLGNILRGDDGIGPIVLQELEKKNIFQTTGLIDAGSDAFIILEHLTQKDPIIIIDCAKMGKNPGEYAVFSVEKSNFEMIGKTISIHGFSFAEIYKMAVGLGEVAPCRIIGVEPQSINFNETLSDEVKNSIPSILNYIIGEANNYAA